MQKNWLLTSDNTKASFTDIAKEAKLSKRTVLDVFIASEKLSQGTIEKVLAIVKKLGYTYSNTPPTMKKCNMCQTVKPLTDYHYNVKNGENYRYAQSRCKECDIIRREKYRETAKKQRVGQYRLQKYGLTEGEYQDLVLFQNNICAICNKPNNKTLNIDHDHKTGKVRGLLCHYCNIGLGLFKDDIDVLNKAINYLSSNSMKE
jgi:RNase P subunit RPR2